MSKWKWLMLQLGRVLWVRAALIGVLGIAAAGLAAVVERFLPWPLPFDIAAGAVDSILSIIASSMLAVTTFSLSVMTSAYGAATSNVTPRATKLLMQDRVTHNVLSTFIGSFLFSIVGIVVLKIGAYGPQGRAVLFLVTIGVLVLIVLSLLRWIDHLTRLGRVSETTDRVEQATRTALTERLNHPYLGGQALPETHAVPATGAPLVRSAETGYVLHVDLSALSACSEKWGADIYLLVVPGAFVHLDTPLAWVGPQDEKLESDARDACLEDMRRAFAIGPERSFDQDPRFGLAVLTEIASRALSPGINDSGTAIDVIGRNARLLTLWAQGGQPQEATAQPHGRIFVPALTCDDLFDDAFRIIARDGAAQIEVQLRLQKALAALAGLGDEAFRAAARRQSELAMARAEASMALEADKALLRDFVQS